MWFKKKHIRLWLMGLAILLAIISFEEIVDDVFFDPLEGDHEASQFDEAIFTLMRAYRSPAINQIMTDLTALGSVSVITTFFLILASIMVIYRDGRGLLYLSIVLAGAGIWPGFLKNFYARTRPLSDNHLVVVSDLSFPSGHSFGATALYIGLAYYAGRYARSWNQEIFFYAMGVFLILLVGTSRVFLGVHYPTDVLAGIAGGVAWGFLVSVIFEAYRLKAGSTRSDQSLPAHCD